MSSLLRRRTLSGRLFGSFLRGMLCVAAGHVVTAPAHAGREAPSTSRVPRQIPVSETTGPAGTVAQNGTPVMLGTVDAHGADLTGRIVQGDDLRVIGDSLITARQGATGVYLQGDRINVVRLSGTLIAGEGPSTGVRLNGSQARLLLNGEGKVTGGATGVDLQGHESVVRQTQPFIVSGGESTGIRIYGHNIRLSGTGTGSASERGTAVLIKGPFNRVNLYDPVVESLPGMHGLSPLEPVLAGAWLGSRISGGGTGLRILGDYNTARLQDTSATAGDGSRGVTLEGSHNRVFSDGGYRYVSAGAIGIEASGSANRITLDSGSLRVSDAGTVGVRVSGAGSRVTTHVGSLFTVIGGATGLQLDGEEALASLGGRMVAGSGSTAVQVAGVGDEVLGASVVNERDGVIVARGIGSRAMSASGLENSSRSSLTNRGRLEVSPGLADDGQPIASLRFPERPAHELGVGMSAVAPLSTMTREQLTATNAGTIVVAGAGVGMMASLPGARVVNQGIITLQSDPRVPAAGPLYGMVALNGAIAVNDSGGVVNVDADHGRAFHTDGISQLVNRGEVNVKGRPVSPSGLQMGDAPARSGTASDQGTTVNLTPTDLNGRTLRAGEGRPGGNTRLQNKATIENGTMQVRLGERLSNEAVMRNIVLRVQGHVENMAGASLDLGSRTPGNVNGTLNNSGTLRVPQWLNLTGTLTNRADGTLNLSGNGAVRYGASGAFVNHGSVVATTPAFADHRRAIYVAGPGTGGGVNTGTLTASGGYGVMTTSGPFLPAPRPGRAGRQGGGRSLFVNQGRIDFTAGSGGAPYALQVRQHRGHDLLNDSGGVITVRGSRAVAMRSDSDSQLVNRGTINLGESGTTDTGMIAMVLGPNSPASAAIVNDEGGVINIHARQSHAFGIGGRQGLLINHGEVNLLCGDGSCGLYGIEGTQARDISDSPALANFEFNPRLQPSPGSGRVQRDLQSLSGYVIGTRPDGGAGTLSGNELDAGGIRIDTGFTAGSAARKADFGKVIRGGEIRGIEKIASLTAAWRARAYRDADGDIGVRMAKQDYRDLVSDASLHPVAAVLERGYDGSALFRSLELRTTADIERAIRQLSGAGMNRMLMPLRTLERRFDHVADSVVEDGNGFGLRLAGFGQQGQPAVRLGASFYDMVAARQRFDLDGEGRLTARYGFARIHSSVGQSAGLNGHSQLFGLHYREPLDAGPVLESEFRYALHQVGSRRDLQYGDVSLRPRADQRQDRFDGQLHLALPLQVAGLKLEPLLGLAWRHRRDAGLTEREAGAQALRLSTARDTALDGVVGLRFAYDGLDHRGHRGWRADAQLLARPALYRQRVERQASFANVPGSGQFVLSSGNGGASFDSRVGLSRRDRNSLFEFSAFLSRDGGVSDRGAMANYLYRF